MSRTFLRLYDLLVKHTIVFLLTASGSHCVSAGITNPVYIQVPPQLWRNSINDCFSAASVLCIGAPMSLSRRAPSSDSATVAGFPGGSLYGMVHCV